MLDEIFATLCVCTAHKFHCSIVIEHCFCIGCHSGQNYAFTILGSLAVLLSNLLSWTVQLISGTFKWNRKSDLHMLPI